MDPGVSAVRATFMGVSTIAFDDGKDSILIDGFFTRPWYFPALLGRISSDERRITQCLEKGQINQNLRAVFVAHSHYDHALDSPSVCKQTGAKLVGSTSTWMIGKGRGLPDDQMIVVSEDPQVFHFGAFRITVVEGIHSPGENFPGGITAPLSTPCAVSSFRTGKCYSYLIEHGEQRVFVHPSANFVPNKLRGMDASTIFLGIGVLGRQSPVFKDNYWHHVVEAVNPKKIVPIHWDNFWLSLDGPLRHLPWLLDNVSLSDQYLRERCKSADIELYFLQAWEQFILDEGEAH
ncbi:hypothetical protein FQN49_002528 [Arthroderma sp. PD_2]|nr:hypothetical protein FQN49_002528 [Arthroderma sp. PD_2]